MLRNTAKETIKYIFILNLVSCNYTEPLTVKIVCPESLPPGYKVQGDSSMYWISKGDSVMVNVDPEATTFEMQSGPFTIPFTTTDSCDLKHLLKQATKR